MHPVLDGHNDLAWQLRLRGIDPDLETDLSGTGLHTDLPRLRRGGVAGQFWSVYVPCGDDESHAVAMVLEQIDLPGDEQTGVNIVKVALDAPLRQIAVNAGLEGGVVVEKVRALKPGFGLDASTGEYVDLMKAGIIDPAKVTRSALQNAASIAALFLTTEAVVADKPEKSAAPAAPGGGGDMDF